VRDTAALSRGGLHPADLNESKPALQATLVKWWSAADHASDAVKLAAEALDRTHADAAEWLRSRSDTIRRRGGLADVHLNVATFKDDPFVCIGVDAITRGIGDEPDQVSSDMTPAARGVLELIGWKPDYTVAGAIAAVRAIAAAEASYVTGYDDVVHILADARDNKAIAAAVRAQRLYNFGVRSSSPSAPPLEGMEEYNALLEPMQLRITTAPDVVAVINALIETRRGPWVATGNKDVDHHLIHILEDYRWAVARNLFGVPDPGMAPSPGFTDVRFAHRFIGLVTAEGITPEGLKHFKDYPPHANCHNALAFGGPHAHCNCMLPIVFPGPATPGERVGEVLHACPVAPKNKRKAARPPTSGSRKSSRLQ
jgi:hypothetical protein